MFNNPTSCETIQDAKTESILMREETGVHRENPWSQVEIYWKLSPHTTFVVEEGGLIGDH